MLAFLAAFQNLGQLQRHPDYTPKTLSLTSNLRVVNP